MGRLYGRKGPFRDVSGKIRDPRCNRGVLTCMNVGIDEQRQSLSIEARWALSKGGLWAAPCVWARPFAAPVTWKPDLISPPVMPYAGAGDATEAGLWLAARLGFGLYRPEDVSCG